MWEDHRVPGPAKTLVELLEQAAEQWPTRVAASFPDETLSYRALHERALGLAASLRAAGVTPGEHVGLLMPNCARMLESFFAVVLAGATPTPLNTRYRTDELPYAIAHADLA